MGNVNGSRARWLLLGAVLGTAFLWAYWSTLASLVATWVREPDYSHGFFVVPVAAYFLWERRQKFPAVHARLAWWGLGLVVLSGVVRLISARYYLEALDGWSIALWAAGVAGLLGGWRVLRWSLPSVLFLLFMVPLPFRLERGLTLPLQSIATNVSCWALQILGQLALPQGHTILLDNHQLEVEQACAGLRIFMGVFAMAYVWVVLTQGPRWQKVALLLGTIPIGILANAARIVAMGLLYRYASDESAQRFTHDTAGLAMIVFAAGLFAILLWYLKKLQVWVRPVDRIAPDSPAVDLSTGPGPTTTEGVPRQPRSHTIRARRLRVVVATVLGLGLLVPAGYFWRGVQLHRSAAVLLQRAETMASQGESASAADYLYWYLHLRPDDSEARVRLAEVYDRGTQNLREKGRAVELYYEAIPIAPQDRLRPLRCRVAELLCETDKFTAAEQEARALLQHDKGDPQGWQLLARSLYGQHRTKTLRARLGTVGEAFERAIELEPGDCSTAIALARIYHDEPQLLGDKQQKLTIQERRRQAEQIVDRMVAARPTAAEVYLERYRYRAQYLLPKATTDREAVLAKNQEDLTAALQYGADHLEVLLQAALAEQQAMELSQQPLGVARRSVQEHGEAAVAHYRHAIEVAPADERAYMGLAEVYRLLGQIPQAIDVCRRGLKNTKSFSLPLHAKLAELLIVQNELAEAEKVLQKIKAWQERWASRMPPELKLLAEGTNDLLRGKWLAQKGQFTEAAALARQVALSPQASGQPDAALRLPAYLLLGDSCRGLSQYSEAASAYEQAAVLAPELAAVHRLAADAWLSANRPEAAVRHYEQALSLEDTAETRLALARARFQQEIAQPGSARNWDSFDKNLAEAKDLAQRKQLAKPWRLALLEADYRVARAEQQGNRQQATEEASKLLRTAEQQLTKENEIELTRGLVLAYQRLGLSAEVERLIDRLVQREPSSGEGCLLRADLALNWAQFEQARLLLRAALETATPKDQPALRRALLLVSIRERRLDTVSEEFSALDGDDPSRLDLACQLTELALDIGELREAQAWEGRIKGIEGEDGLHWRHYKARRLLDETRGSAADARLSAAAELLAEIRSQQPTWAASYLLQGQLLERCGKLEQAIGAYQEAIRLGDQRLAVYARLVALLVATKQRDRACSTLEEGAKSKETAEVQKASFLARGYDSLGDVEQAMIQYRRAVALAPHDPQAKTELADFCRRSGKSDRQEIETLLRDAVKLSPSFAPARRALAVLLVEQGGEKRWQEAQQLFEQAGKEPGGLSNTDRRLQADLLCRRGGTGNRHRARQMLEETLTDPKSASPLDRLWLARLYEVDGDIEQARQQFAMLVGQKGSAISHLVAYTEFLLQHGPAKEAEVQLKKLEETAPAADLSTLGLRARWLQQQGRAAEIEPRVEARAQKLLKKDVKDRTLEAQVCREIGAIYMMSEQYAAAARWYQRLRDLNSTFYEPLATCLAKQNKMRDVAALCVDAAKSDKSDYPAVVLAQIFATAAVTAEDLQRGESLWSQALDKHPKDVDLLLSVAAVRVLQNRCDEAVALYRRILATEPLQLQALNNLATLLGDHAATREEALRYVDRAMDIAGPQSWLQDTKGMILVGEGKLDEAIARLDDAIKVPQPDPRYYLHLAVAYDRTGHADKARAALGNARSRKVSEQVLTPLDRKYLADLETKFHL